MLENKTDNDLILPRNKDVVVSDGLLFEKKARFEDNFFSSLYTITFSTQFKPLAFLGKYASTFVTTGAYSENELGRMGWEIKRNLGYCLKIRTR